MWSDSVAALQQMRSLKKLCSSETVIRTEVSSSVKFALQRSPIVQRPKSISVHKEAKFERRRSDQALEADMYRLFTN